MLLALGALGNNGQVILREIAQWFKEIAHVIAEGASASGVYDKQYPEMVITPRGLRIRLMGEDSPLSLGIIARANKKVKEIVNQALE